jgi:hypothetical protein
MTKLLSLQDIKDTAVKLLGTPMGSDIESIKTAEEAFHQLVDRFYQENEEMMAPRQCEGAKRDFEYFMRLIDLALAYFTDDMETSGQIQ